MSRSRLYTMMLFGALTLSPLAARADDAPSDMNDAAGQGGAQGQSAGKAAGDEMNDEAHKGSDQTKPGAPSQSGSEEKGNKAKPQGGDSAGQNAQPSNEQP
jgi:hypothetical protein